MTTKLELRERMIGFLMGTLALPIVGYLVLSVTVSAAHAAIACAGLFIVPLIGAALSLKNLDDYYEVGPDGVSFTHGRKKVWTVPLAEACAAVSASGVVELPEDERASLLERWGTAIGKSQEGESRRVFWLSRKALEQALEDAKKEPEAA